MAIDSRAKGRTAETNAKKELIKLTGLGWERTPLSGALSAKHKLKGDLYVPDTPIKYCVEIKHYKEDHLTSKILTNKNPQLQQWWEQTVREALEIDKEPLLIFKFDRSKWFAAFSDWDLTLNLEDNNERFITIHNLGPKHYSTVYVCTLTDFCAFEDFTNE
jgi:hypothetical protein